MDDDAERKYPLFTEIHYSTAEDLWTAVSPTSDLFNPPYCLVFRGQADVSWSLIPAILGFVRKVLPHTT